DLESARESGDTSRTVSLLDAVSEWLWSLHSSTWQPSPDELAESLEADIDTVEAATLVSADSAQRLQRILGSLPVKRIPMARCHGDFNPNNILISGESQVAGVVDWEYSQIGCALFDLFSIYR